MFTSKPKSWMASTATAALRIVGFALALPFLCPFLPFVAIAWLLHWAVRDMEPRNSAELLVPLSVASWHERTVRSAASAWLLMHELRAC